MTVSITQLIIHAAKGNFNMKIDNETLKKVRSLDDEALKEAINVVADITGADPKSRKKALSNIKTVRKRINNATEKDIDRTIQKIGVDDPTLEEIISKLNLK